MATMKLTERWGLLESFGLPFFNFMHKNSGRVGERSSEELCEEHQLKELVLVPRSFFIAFGVVGHK
jgi:hypothetical protein